MLNIKAAEDGYVALEAFQSAYESFLGAASNDGDNGYGKYHRDLKEVRRLAGKLGEAIKRTGRPSRFLEAALVAYDYADALTVGTSSLSELDRKARVCAAAMRVVQEAVRYEFMDGVFSCYAKVDNPGQLEQSLVH